MTLHIFTDGACRGNPGPGGWGVLIKTPSGEITLSGGAPHTTNNRMELMAVISALESFERSETVSLSTDSQYVHKGITLWLASWKKKNWKTASGHLVKNKDLWERLEQASLRHRITWLWVRGHAGHPENERADALAKEAVGRV